ncbi:MAG: dihydrofolate reductase family protein [Candidatus Dormibacteraceae bacterium]
MGKVICHQSMALDGFSAGANQSLDNPIGDGGMSLHEWMFDTAAFRRMQGLEGGPESADSAIVAELSANSNVGAYVMGRNMFAAGRGEWDESWKGWWGENPPYHAPTFVLTHYPRNPVPMRGGTTFYFVTDGIESAMRQAREAAGARDVQIAGGASTINQSLRAGLLDELFLHIAPIVLGSGERLFQDVGDLHLTPVEVIASARVTHIRYRIDR